MLQLKGGDVALIYETVTYPNLLVVLSLGTPSGMKVKYEQYAILRASEFPNEFHIMTILKACTDDDQRLFPYSIEFYRRALSNIGREKLGVALGITPHSPRAGFATERIARGVSFVQTQEDGRWKSASSFRTYIDVVGALHVGTMLKQ